MDLDNRTTYPAYLFRAGIDERRLAASVAVRVTYDIVEGRLEPAKEQPWKFSPGPWDGPYGPMDGDEVFYRGGVDVLVFGHAHAPGGRSVTTHDVVVEVGPLVRRTRVFGDRVWEKRWTGRFSSSAPAPYTRMPLDLAHAYGGKDKWDGLDVPYSNNPDGKGFVTVAERVAGTQLPNLEDPEHLITTWEDRPEPVGFGCCPTTSGLRLRNSVELNDRAALSKLKPTYFNSAFPRMIVPALPAGSPVRLSGVLADGPLEFSIPDHRLAVRMAFGEERAECPLRIDQLGIEADVRRVFITWRYPFRYVLLPLQKRSCVLVEQPTPVPVGVTP
jgi:hypothetical protein